MIVYYNAMLLMSAILAINNTKNKHYWLLPLNFFVIIESIINLIALYGE